MEGGDVGHNFKRGSHKDHSSQVWFSLVECFQRRRFNGEKYDVRRKKGNVGKNSQSSYVT